jgi:hypothetical protein
MEFWRRRTTALGLRCYLAVDKGGGRGGWFRKGGHGGARSCPERDRFGFGADILSRVADLSNPVGESATARCSSPEWCNHRGSSTNTIEVQRNFGWGIGQRRQRSPAWARCAVPMSNMPLQRTKACQLSVDDCPAGAARLFK